MILLEIGPSGMIVIANGVIAVILGVFAFFFRRFVSENDRRHTITEQRVASAELEAKEIKKNYLKRFEEVHTTIRSTAGQTVETLGEKIEAIQKDKHQYRYQQAKEAGTLIEKVSNTERALQEIKEDLREMRDRKP